MRRWSWLIIAGFTLGVGCGGETVTDAGRPDTGTTDTGDQDASTDDVQNPTDVQTPDGDQPDVQDQDTGLPPDDVQADAGDETVVPPTDAGDETVVPPTDGGDSGGPTDGGNCAMGENLCGTMCISINDANNCGTCGNVCAMGQMCVMGQCTTPVVCAAPTPDRCGTNCTNFQTDNNNCGMCGRACTGTDTCQAGTCRPAVVCPMMGQTACGAACVNLQTDNNNCGACNTACTGTQVCTAGMCVTTPCSPATNTRCSGTCVDTNTSTANCGRCGNTCATGDTCAAGRCVPNVNCALPTLNCNNNCINPSNDNLNCGRCGNACAMGQTCQNGTCAAVCTCPAGQFNCGPAPMCNCRQPLTDNNNCGTCGTVCMGGTSCAMGACVCPAGQANCGGTCRATLTDNNNCGACGRVCAGGQTCQNGACACPTGQMLCGAAGAQTCQNLMTSAQNCGACGRACAAGFVCNAGTCGCPTGQTQCGATCLNLNTDNNNCGRCGTVCTGGTSCQTGVCRCPAGQITCGTPARCTDSTADTNNCGACGRVCGNNQACVNGTCMGGTAPANDLRANATVISLATPQSTFTVNTLTARNDTAGNCTCTTGPDVFYRFTLTQREMVYVDTNASNYNTSVFIQDALGRNLTAPGGAPLCDDDNGTGPGGGLGCTTNLRSMLVANLAAGNYFVVLSGCGAGVGNLIFQHTPVSNNATTVISPSTTNTTVTGNLAAGVTGSVGNTCCSGGPENSYYWVTCPNFAGAQFSATTCNAAATNVTDISLDERSPGRAPGPIVCNDDVQGSCGQGSLVNSTIPAGAGLHVVTVDSCIRGAGDGAYGITFRYGPCPANQNLCGTCVNLNTGINAPQLGQTHCGSCYNQCPGTQWCNTGRCVTPPANDDYAGAITINMAVAQSLLSSNTTNARNNAVGGCAGTDGADVFYRFTLTRPELVYADSELSTYDAALFFQTEMGANHANVTIPGVTNGVTCNNDGGLTGCNTGRQAQVLAQLPAGTYILVVTGPNTAAGRGVANIRFQHLPVGSISPVQFLTAGNGLTVSGTTAGGVGIIPDPGACTGNSPEATYFWYTCFGAAQAAFTAQTCARATWDTVLHQQSASRTPVDVTNDDACGPYQSRVNSTIPAGAGLHTLYLDGCVFGGSGNTGSGAYSINYTRP